MVLFITQARQWITPYTPPPSCATHKDISSYNYHPPPHGHMHNDTLLDIYPTEIEIKDTTDADHRASYLDLDLSYDRDK